MWSVALAALASVSTVVGDLGECTLPTSNNDGICHFSDGSVAAGLQPFTTGNSASIVS
jgi:hypothetical protein